MKAIHLVIATSFAATALISGCAGTDSRPVSSPSYSSSYPSGYGVIDAIDIIRGSGNAIGGGTIIGAIVGGVVGHQVGGGRGNDVATVAGAVGGAVVGHEIEKGNRSQDVYRIRVRMENGGYQTVTQDSANDLRVGDRARVENDRVYRYSENDRGDRNDNRGNRY
jgi:outer membrane lipoprotein SlyB